MTELDILLRARMYMELLAQGVDPVSGQPLPQGCGLDQERLSRCFSYVSGVLGKVIDNGGFVGQRVRTKKFYLSPEQRACVPVTPYPVRISEFIDSLYRVAADPDMKKLSATKVLDHLIAAGFLMKQATAEGGTQKVPTEAGLRLGLSAKMCSSRDGDYLGVFYDAEAQRYLLEHLDQIMEGK